jgi:uncharacterized protein (DUF1800 family)
LKASSVGSAGVTLKWAAPKGAKPAYYVILRDGKSLGRTSRTSYSDTKVKPGKVYRYAIRAYDAQKRAGAISRSLRVTVPRPAPKAPGPTTNPVSPVAPIAPVPIVNGGSPVVEPTVEPTVTPTPEPVKDVLSTAMVDRLFWRAGFGPSEANRVQWTGKRHGELVEWLLNTPRALTPTDKPPKPGDIDPFDPLASDVELELEWIDGMQRAINPLPDRLAFFWHRHWAISREDGIPFKWILNYRDRLLRFADFGQFPDATFRQLAYEMTTTDTAMSMYLNGNQNVKGKPNENYARELLELFCTGPTNLVGDPNYSQEDVAELAKALTGWFYNGTPTNPAYGVVVFGPSRFEMGAKKLFAGRPYEKLIPAVTGNTNPATNPAAATWGKTCVDQALDAVLAHPEHTGFLIRKLWAEFIASPIPQPTLDALSAQYKQSGFQLKPLVRGILMHPLIFESIEEPNLIKPPIVQIVGVLRQLGAPLRSNLVQVAMINMQQRVYSPPNVAGWEGGMSWLNTNTVQGRFDLVRRVQHLKYSRYYDEVVAPFPAADINYPDQNALKALATPAAWFDHAYVSVGRPWISTATKDKIMAFAATPLAVTSNRDNDRRQRFYALQALILGGPDGQVM